MTSIMMNMYFVKILDFDLQFFINRLGVFMKAVDVQKAEWFNESVYSSDSVLFVIQFGTCMAKEALVVAEFIQTEVLDWVSLMRAYSA